MKWAPRSGCVVFGCRSSLWFTQDAAINSGVERSGDRGWMDSEGCPITAADGTRRGAVILGNWSGLLVFWRSLAAQPHPWQRQDKWGPVNDWHLPPSKNRRRPRLALPLSVSHAPRPRASSKAAFSPVAGPTVCGLLVAYDLFPHRSPTIPDSLGK